ncbi:MAG: PTS sugar transporter subunit IIA [Leptonema illini]|uniref:PTS sugar transporter subunit IIA n=1 Tax=Leptonema illini TaxID=183 RepID=A0A833H497_9LEPT|nr:MAG: PTS sugar transporter subunit IIA [Leptonema illini]PKL32945.1 MAG: PTS sugar transporter subunit IIA [Spirochaetae bacterium HGW-Spirochaetae-10]
MNLKDIIPADRIFHYSESPADKYALLEDLMDRTLAGTAFVNKREKILEALLDRERSMSTGIGSGIAIPHCSTQHIEGMLASIAILNEKLPFEAVDDRPVGIVVLLLLSRNDFDRHIKTLAAIARAFNQEKLRDAVAQTTTAEEVMALFEKMS